MIELDRKKQILVIDDEANMRHMLQAMLESQGYLVKTANDGVQGVDLLQGQDFDFVLCDIKMPRMDGLAFLEEVANLALPAPIIMMSAFGTVELAVEAMKSGAYDYISKPFKMDEIVLVLKKAEERERLREENIRLRGQVQELQKARGFSSVIGNSQVLEQVLQLARKVALYDTSVLITGESGTGKELMAAGIHAESQRSRARFVAINCGSIPENLMESEFFGYRRGAFTGADRDKTGLFAEADGGTLLLDEIGELPLAMQVKLLRVLQEREIQPLGAAKTHAIDVRVVAATARNLEQEVAQGRFREDLYYRLNVVHLELPPLRERREDILELCDVFIAKAAARMGLSQARITAEARRCLLRYSWPGNVRQLKNVMERAMILSENGVIDLQALSPEIKGDSCEMGGYEIGKTLSIKVEQKKLERRLIQRALQSTGGNKSRAAELLEISYPALLAKIKLYGL